MSRILRDLKQPAAPPSEAKIRAVITPFFMSSKFLNGNLYLFSLLIMFWATQDDWHFPKAILIGLAAGSNTPTWLFQALFLAEFIQM